MGRLLFFDANCTLGPRTAPRPETMLTDAEIAAELARHGITHALCSHAHAQELDPATGNRRLASLDTAGWPVVVRRCLVVMPHHTGELPRAGRLRDYLRENQAAAVRLCPRVHGFSMGATGSGELLATLEETRIPTLIEMDQTSWDELDDVARRHPGLRLVALRVGYRADRMMYPVLERRARIFIETSNYVGHRAIEHFVDTFGAGRLVFGTAAPVFAPGGAVAPVLYAEVDEAAKSAIAGGNLRRLIEDSSVGEA